ncbi:hypothetical protein IVB18_30570 [Bradyrhizobium sp. 186]|uniref:hypothetical protein n=1 Tax=Bradyrhizobium sp. 186 TaxID=2782654 RepID=UPI00200084A0|nr:hypothetical protein [Bradyrhizobium sp. 186]UPK32593.1 hypothetical protein IVB18_30570 [Bradyrhizobium sp. 186]
MFTPDSGVGREPEKAITAGMALNIATLSSGSVWLNRAGVVASAIRKFHGAWQRWMILMSIAGPKAKGIALLVDRQQRKHVGLPEPRYGTEVGWPAAGR